MKEATSDERPSSEEQDEKAAGSETQKGRPSKEMKRVHSAGKGGSGGLGGCNRNRGARKMGVPARAQRWEGRGNVKR